MTFWRRTQRIASTILICSLGSAAASPCAGASQSGQESAESKLAALESSRPGALSDEHGNWSQTLQDLAILRFDATGPIIASIERLEKQNGDDALIASLYSVLGFVKDPASISWLRSTAPSEQTSVVYRSYRAQWRSLDGFGCWEWLEGRESWVEFWIDEYDRDPSPKGRFSTLKILRGFDDHRVRTFFRRVAMETRYPEESLLSSAYLSKHGEAADFTRIEAAFNSLAGDPANAPFLSEMAVTIRDGRLVPHLIELINIAEPNVSPPSFPAQRALQLLTFEIEDREKAQWREWYVVNGSLGRNAWLNRTVSTLRMLLKDDKAKARVYFESRIHVLTSTEFLPSVEAELEPLPLFQSAIAGWINMTYTCALRPTLSPLALRVAKRPDQLEVWALNILRGLGYLGEPPDRNWARYVRNSNLRV